MNNYINLVQNKDEEITKEKNKIKTLNIIAGSFLTIVIFCAVIIFIISSQFSLASIKRDQNAAIYGISQLKNKAAKLLMINDRVRGISAVLDKRKDYSTAINNFLLLVPQGVSVKDFNLDKDNVKLTVSSSSLLSINAFLDSLIETSAQKKVIKNLVMEGIIVNVKNGQYILSLSGIIL